MWFGRVMEMFIILAPSIPTCSMVEPLALSKAVLTISYLIVILSGCFLFWGNFFFFLPQLHRKLCFLAELSECPVKPLVTTFLLQEVPQSPAK